MKKGREMRSFSPQETLGFGCNHRRGRTAGPACATRCIHQDQHCRKFSILVCQSFSESLLSVHSLQAAAVHSCADYSCQWHCVAVLVNSRACPAHNPPQTSLTILFLFFMSSVLPRTPSCLDSLVLVCLQSRNGGASADCTFRTSSRQITQQEYLSIPIFYRHSTFSNTSSSTRSSTLACPTNSFVSSKRRRRFGPQSMQSMLESWQILFVAIVKRCIVECRPPLVC